MTDEGIKCDWLLTCPYSKYDEQEIDWTKVRCKNTACWLYELEEYYITKKKNNDNDTIDDTV